MTSNKLPFVSVVVPHKGPEKLLISCLGALRQQTYPKDSFEVIVVRNEAEQRPPPLTLETNESFLWQPKGFSYAARNFGIERARGSIIALTDSDTLPDARWIAEGVDSLESGADVIAGDIDLICLGKVTSWGNSYDLQFGFDQRTNAKLGLSVTANTFARRTLFDNVGLFDDRLESGGDFEWCRRATLYGAKILFAERSRVSHPTRPKVSDQIRKAIRTSTPVKYVDQPNEWLRQAAARLRLGPGELRIPIRYQPVMAKAMLMRLLLLSVRVASVGFFLGSRKLQTKLENVTR